MLRKFLQYQISLTDPGKPLHRLRPLMEAIDTFFFETPQQTTSGPHIRDGVDLKRIMALVVIALTPCILMAIWNTGLQKLVYSSVSDYQSYLISPYFTFAKQNWKTILAYGAGAFLPIMFISYFAGGVFEVLFACVRKHPISEGFLVTGMLYALILPPTLPYWMVFLGVGVGITLSKELFGGTGYNILNPALVCRCFLYFTFPTKMTGAVWVGTNPTTMQKSISAINQALGYDGVTQATALGVFNTPNDIKCTHINAILSNTWPDTFNSLTAYLTTPSKEGGLNLSFESLPQALAFAKLKAGTGIFSDANLFFGNMLGSLGETSTLACLIGAALILITGIGSWRTMLSVALGVIFTAGLLKIGAHIIGPQAAANFDFPIYKHFLMGGLAFGLVFMATDPVSSPDMSLSKWIYGFVIGTLTVIIRAINPAFPEGVMLAILFGNVIGPLLDHYALKRYRKGYTYA
ncbi:MAG: NADH:ubiquinone reductase (Na(+)-transporting) subunit B [Chlamydiales bacterium]|nr:NADH:ubiquinone reductase (Na(+)-transporting) subunit B [Chlamydiales bacterium]